MCLKKGGGDWNPLRTMVRVFMVLFCYKCSMLNISVNLSQFALLVVKLKEFPRERISYTCLKKLKRFMLDTF